MLVRGCLGAYWREFGGSREIGGTLATACRAKAGAHGPAFVAYEGTRARVNASKAFGLSSRQHRSLRRNSRLALATRGRSRDRHPQRARQRPCHGPPLAAAAALPASQGLKDEVLAVGCTASAQSPAADASRRERWAKLRRPVSYSTGSAFGVVRSPPSLEPPSLDGEASVERRTTGSQVLGGMSSAEPLTSSGAARAHGMTDILSRPSR